MRLLAQHGWGPADKIQRGLGAGIIDGYIFSPRDAKPEAAQKLFQEGEDDATATVRLFDPQLYTMNVAESPNINVGQLSRYSDYFPDDPAKLPSQTQLLDDKRVTETVIRAMDYQRQLSVTSMIAPNVLVPHRMDSVWGAVALKFIAQAGRLAHSGKFGAPILATLCLGSDALMDRSDVDDLLRDLTGRAKRPDGFYVLFSFPDGEMRMHCRPEHLGMMLYIVYSLSINGFEVTVGYGDYLAAFFELAGAQAVATGWFETLKKFSINRFIPEPSFRQRANPRYSSPALYNRILVDELFGSGMADELKSSPSYLREYRATGGASLTTQALQHWAAVRNTLEAFDTTDVDAGVNQALVSIQEARRYYTQLRRARISLDPKSEAQHLDLFEKGLHVFLGLLR